MRPIDEALQTQSDTPETDEVRKLYPHPNAHLIAEKLARKLERERDELTEALEYILGIGLTEKTKAKAEKALQQLTKKL